ncbi:MAG: ABC-2 family transporter protein [Candidatus Micrarchaeota archaeon]|nr:ABC-2 family transporter protein [Candidatus Micrarchaeota archaeon]
MFASLEKYYGLFRIRAKGITVYKGDFVVTLLLRVLFPVLMIFVWTAVYVTTGTTKIAGFSLLGIYAYFLITASLAPFRSDIDDMIGSDVLTGAIAVFLVRPITYLLDSIITDLSTVVVGFFTLTVPILALAVLFVPLNASLLLFGLFGVEAIAAYLISMLLEIMVGLLAVYFTSYAGMAAVINRCMSFFGGGLLPLSFFPSQISTVLSYLPFQFLYYVPAATLSGSISVQSSLFSLAIAAIWIVGLFVAAKFAWRAAKKHINAVGV